MAMPPFLIPRECFAFYFLATTASQYFSFKWRAWTGLSRVKAWLLFPHRLELSQKPGLIFLTCKTKRPWWHWKWCIGNKVTRGPQTSLYKHNKRWVMCDAFRLLAFLQCRVKTTSFFGFFYHVWNVFGWSHTYSTADKWSQSGSY